MMNVAAVVAVAVAVVVGGGVIDHNTSQLELALP